jgi:hypothetical protein
MSDLKEARSRKAGLSGFDDIKGGNIMSRDEAHDYRGGMVIVPSG